MMAGQFVRSPKQSQKYRKTQEDADGFAVGRVKTWKSRRCIENSPHRPSLPHSIVTSNGFAVAGNAAAPSMGTATSGFESERSLSRGSRTWYWF